MPSKLLGCIGFLYKVVHITGRFSVFISHFSFPFNFRTSNALVLKFGTLPLSALFSNTLSAIFVILFCSRVIHRFVPKKWAKIDMRACFSTKLYFKSEFKKSRAWFFSSQIPLAEKTKRMSLERPVFNLKAIEFGSFFAYFHLFRHLKVIKLFQKYMPKHFIFDKLSDKKKRLKIALQVSKFGFSPIVMP